MNVSDSSNPSLVFHAMAGVQDTQSMKQTLCREGHPLTKPNLYFNSDGMRMCKTCHNSRITRRRRAYRQAITKFAPSGAQGAAVEIFWSRKLELAKRTEQGFKSFIQGMANRIAQGHARYGHPKVEKKYLTRLKLEVKAYQKSGNQEHLINVANYCFLESLEPEHKKSHFDSSIDSATRGKL